MMWTLNYGTLRNCIDQKPGGKMLFTEFDEKQKSHITWH